MFEILIFRNDKSFSCFKLYKKRLYTYYVCNRFYEKKTKIIIINESGLYELLFKSRKKEAIAFRDWIFEEVLPSIRKTGKYSIPDKLSKKSKEDRNLLTSSWKDHGITKPL